MIIDTPKAEDFAEWSRLYAGYAAFYGVTQTDQMRARVWGWLQDPSHPVKGFVARGESGLAGLVHFRAFSRPLSASTGGYLDDLFVDPVARGSKVARTLIAAVSDHGRAEGWTVLRWITANDNLRARKLYDQVARETAWITYDIAL